MKTRSGFVSNSSSSSFILYGIYNPDLGKLAEALWDHCGEEVFKDDNITNVDELRDAIDDDRDYVECIKGVPVELVNYDDDYLGVSLSFDREDLIKPKFTEGELAEIDAFLKKVQPNTTPSIHEGEYYC